MKNITLKASCLIAALYFGNDVWGQAAQDTLGTAQDIEEVVLIGYGTAKKVDLTSSIATVNADEIVKTPAGQAMQSLQGKVAGVRISSFGSPGSSPQIDIRGLHSLYGSNQPLFVVDGIFVDNIDFLNPTDIKEFTILKDASASAIYGVRAANGVVVITTKEGRYNSRSHITYDSYYGIQRAVNVVKMANAEQFVNFALESNNPFEIASIDAAMQRFGRSRINPNLPDVNTDWFKETLRIAPMTSHSVSAQGGSEKVNYSIGGDYFYQQGIQRSKNSYQRFNLRAKVEAKVNDWLTLGTSNFFSRSQQQRPEPSAWQTIYYAVPILPIYDPTYVNAFPHPYADAQALGYRSHDNPFALMDNTDDLSVRRRATLNVYADISIIPKELKFKSSLSYNNRNDNGRRVLFPYFVNDDFGYQRPLEQSSITRSNGVFESYIFDNVLTWDKSFGQHDLTLMGGTSYRDEFTRGFSASGFLYDGTPFNRDRKQTWYIQNTKEDTRTASDSGSRFYGVSYFGRLSYKFADRYIAYATYRIEGSNKYKDKYVKLPAFGASWVISKEDFMQNIGFINLLKLRAGWGRLANDAVPANRPSTASAGQSVFGDVLIPGLNFSTYDDRLGWEFTEEQNYGLSAELFGRRLSIEADYFIKDTKNLGITVLPIIGNQASFANVGSLRNQGYELSATWKGRIGSDFGYNISGNYSHIRNKVTNLFGQSFIERGESEFRQMLAVGQPVDVFYGWVIDGVYQNQSQVDGDPTAVFANNQGAGTVIPGYFKFKDLDGNGQIDADDRTYLGSPLPKYYFGGSLGFDYKNWDLSVAFYGQGGNKILNRKRGEVLKTQGRNVDAELAINRWHGEGTTNKFPSSAGYRTLWNERMSSFWLEKGDFLRIQNIQLGYTLKSDRLPEMRFTATADRPFLWSKSKILMNPEVGYNGVDAQVYPTPAVFSVGYSVKF